MPALVLFGATLGSRVVGESALSGATAGGICAVTVAEPGPPARSGEARAVVGPAPLDLVRLSALMALTTGSPEVVVGLIDGPVAISHGDLARDSVLVLTGGARGDCVAVDSAACLHGTFVAGILAARRTSPTPGICPDCTVLVRPIFHEEGGGGLPAGANPEELAAAVIECVDAGARVLNVSAALTHPLPGGARHLKEAFDHAARRGVIAVAAAGNERSLGSSSITRHPWVIPVVACDRQGRPDGQSTLGHSIGRRGLRAPGEAITSLGPGNSHRTFGGTSAAAPFVSGAAALLWSAFPAATAPEIRFAMLHAGGQRRSSVVPPLLDAWGAYLSMVEQAAL